MNNLDLKIDKIAVKNLLIRIAHGQLSKKEQENLEKAAFDLNINQLRKIKVIAKELIFDELDRLEKEGNFFLDDINLAKVFGNQRIKQSFHSLVNLAFSIFNENLVHEALVLRKNESLSQEEKSVRIMRKLSQEITRVAAKRTPIKITNYPAVEKKFVKKMKEAFVFGRAIYSQVRKNNYPNWNDIKSLNSLMRSMGVEEIRVAKNKGRELILDWINNQYKSTSPLITEAKNLAKSCLNLLDSLMDEKVIERSLAIIDIVIKKIEQSGGIKNFNPDSLLEDNQFQVLFQQSIVDAIRIFDELSDKEEAEEIAKENAKAVTDGKDKVTTIKPSYLVEKEEVALNNLLAPKEDNKLNQSDQKEEKLDAKLSTKKLLGLMTSFVSGFNKQKGAPKYDTDDTEDSLSLQKVEKKLTTPTADANNKGLSGGVIAALAVGAFLIGGFIVWLFVQKKKTNDK